MKKYVNRILYIIIFIVAISGIKSYGIYSVKSITSGNFTYSIDSNNNAIIDSYHGNDSNLVIPSTIDGYKVISIDAHAFDENNIETNGSVLINVKVSEGIEKIDNYAFVKCHNLKSISLPDSLTTIGSMAFLECTSLTKITIPPNVKKLGDAFENSGLVEFIVPETVEKFEDSFSFRGCESLEKFIVYSKDIVYPSDRKVYYGDELIMEKPIHVFEYCSSNLVFYGYPNSTTEKFTKYMNYKFKDISALNNSKTSTNNNDKNDNVNKNLDDDENFIGENSIGVNSLDNKVVYKDSNFIANEMKSNKILNNDVENQVDNELPKKLPSTGVYNMYLIVLIMILLITSFVIIRYKEYKDL